MLPRRGIRTRACRVRGESAIVRGKMGRTTRDPKIKILANWAPEFGIPIQFAGFCEKISLPFNGKRSILVEHTLATVKITQITDFGKKMQIYVYFFYVYKNIRGMHVTTG